MTGAVRTDRGRGRRHGRFWPSSLFGRIAVILVGGFLLLQIAAIGLYWMGRPDGESFEAGEPIARRVAAVASLYEAAPESDRHALLTAVDNPWFRVRVQPAPPQDAGRAAVDDTAFVRNAIAPVLAQLGHSDAAIAVESGRDRPHVIIALPAGQGDWLHFRVAAPRRPHRPPRWAIFWIALTGTVLVAAVWGARRTARPLERFAEAADRFGIDVAAPPLEEHGSHELRRAISAFNRMQERLRRLVEDRTMMLAAVSHDLRTMLTRLRLRADYIADDDERAKALADLDTMTAMLDESLAFARDTVTAEDRRPVDLAELLQSLCDDFADAGHAVTYSGPAHFSFIGHPVALRRLFANLIENGVRYGSVAEVGLEPGADEVVATVGDRGPGIPDTFREQVFQPFFRLEGSRSRQTGGTGLGLAVARSVARSHGGDVALHGRDGGGTLVRVAMPGGNDRRGYELVASSA